MRKVVGAEKWIENACEIIFHILSPYEQQRFSTSILLTLMNNGPLFLALKVLFLCEQSMTSLSFFLQLTMIGQVVRRSISTSAVRRLHIEQEGKFGANLPFQTKNKLRFTLMFGIYVITGFTAPFLAVRHQLVKKQ